MHRRKRNRNFRLPIGGVALILVGTVVYGWWNKPEAPIYTNLPVSGGGYMMNLRADFPVPPKPTSDVTAMSSVPVTTSTETMRTSKPIELLDITLPPAEPIDKMEMPAKEEVTILAVDEQSSLRLPSSKKEMKMENSPVSPNVPASPKSALSATHENPYLTTD